MVFNLGYFGCNGRVVGEVPHSVCDLGFWSEGAMGGLGGLGLKTFEIHYFGVEFKPSAVNFTYRPCRPIPSNPNGPNFHPGHRSTVPYRLNKAKV